MSFLVERPLDDYLKVNLDAFAVAADFSLDNARAMMWLSQLAYETAHKSKVDQILNAWGFATRELISHDPPELHLPLTTACVVVAGGHGATIVAFAGTDPLNINDWITDLRALPSEHGIHTGFQEAVTATWDQIKTAIVGRPAGEQVFFTGHSLGGALAIIAAMKALSIENVRPTAVYTFGSPRPGNQQFADAYTPVLGDATFRLVYGADIVPTLPPSIRDLQPLPAFRHVGRSIQCSSGGRFDSQTPILSRDQNKPDFVDTLFASAQHDLRALLAGRLIDPIGSGPLRHIIGLLPRPIRDHVPDNYFQALA